LVTHNWLWKTFVDGQRDLFIVDFLWLMIGIIGLLAFYKTKKFFQKIQ